MSTLVMDSALAPVAGERGDQLAEISRKLDLLTQSMMVLGQQVNYLQEQAENSRRRQQSIDDLLADLTPVVKDMYNAAEEQLEEMQQFVQLEDLLLLAKRAARNTWRHTAHIYTNWIKALYEATPYDIQDIPKTF